MRVAFVTFGCRLNHAEALSIEAQYATAGHTIVPISSGPVPNPSGSVPTPLGSVPNPSGPVPIPSGPVPNPSGSVPNPSGPVPISSGSVPNPSGSVPELIVVRGCSVTAKAQRDCEKAIARLKTRFPKTKIIITGCLPGAIKENVPPSNSQPVINLSTSRAYLKIQDGCSGKCAFCIVPQFRGIPRSVPFNQVLKQAEAFLTAGFHELVVTGCNLALYHDSGHGLPDLLEALAQLSPMGTGPEELGTAPEELGTGPKRMGTGPNHRVRLGSLEPGVCDERLLDVFEKNSNICRFIHLSVQSGSNRILKSMNRPYCKEQIVNFCMAARRRLGPRLALGADIITGFPGESNEDFALTRDLIAGDNLLTPGFVNLHVFPYSERPGTPAATMPGTIPRELRIARARELERLGHENRLRFAAMFINQTVQTCVEKDGNGWTSEYLYAKLPPGFTRRQLVEARVSAIEADTLIVR